MAENRGNKVSPELITVLCTLMDGGIDKGNFRRTSLAGDLWAFKSLRSAAGKHEGRQTSKGASGSAGLGLPCQTASDSVGILELTSFDQHKSQILFLSPLTRL